MEQYLMKPSERMTWEEYREKHKEKLDRMGDGVERESKKHREMLDEERRLKVSAQPAPIVQCRCPERMLWFCVVS